MKFLIILLLFPFNLWAQRDTISINENWNFSIDSLYIKEIVSLPHTWNVQEKTQNFYGKAYYEKELIIPKNWKKKQISLHFGAINHGSEFFINGKKVHENIGDGFNKIILDITRFLQFGRNNSLKIIVNNDYGKNKIPYSNSFDWPNDGGIIRPVKMIVSDKNAVKNMFCNYRFSPENSSATINLKLKFYKNPTKILKYKIKILEENQTTRNLVFEKIFEPKNIEKQTSLDFVLENIKAWHFDEPNLYRIEAEILEKGKCTDKISQNVGFRKIELKQGKIIFNNEEVKLSGVEWTAGSNPNFGFAEPKSEIIRMAKLMKGVNTVFTRLHFQQDDAFYDFCDRNGILVQSEIPLWGGETPANARMDEIAKRQLNTMIENLYNHACIFSWGVGNELAGRNEEMKKMISGWIDFTKNLDKTRSVIYVSNSIAESFPGDKNYTPDAGNYGDYLCMNDYFGSWHQYPEALLGDYLDKIHKAYPEKPFFISEFGLCEPNFRGGDERRIRDMIYHIGVYESKSYINGAIYFDLTDYRTHYPGTSENNKYRRRIHGVYDMYGKPKPSAKVLREMFSPVDVQQVNQWSKGKLTLTIFGNKGIPEFTVKNYKIYLSEKPENYKNSNARALITTLKPGEKIHVELEDLFEGEGIVTVENPLGYIVSQKSFYRVND